MFLFFCLSSGNMEHPTNQQVFDKLKECTVSETSAWLHSILPTDQQEEMLQNSIVKNVTALEKERQNKEKSKSRPKGKLPYEKFCSAPFEYPEVEFQKRVQHNKTCPDQEQLQEDSSLQEYKLEQVEVKLKRSRSAVDYRDRKIAKLESKLETMTDHTACKSQMKTLTEETRNWRRIIFNYMRTLKKLHQQLQKQRDHEVIDTMWVDPVTKKKCYTPEIIKCVYSLQESHVGSSHIGNCISSVLCIMTGRSCSDIPSKSTIQNWNTTRL